MNRTIVIGDIHGVFSGVENLLNKINPDSTDTIISVGDILDKGPDPDKVIELFRTLNVLVVMSNHDRRYIKFFKQGKRPEDITNPKHAEQYSKVYPDLIRWLSEHETEPYLYVGDTPKFIISHAGLLPNISLDSIVSKKHLIDEFIRVRWVDADTHKFVPLVKENGEYRPEHPNVVPWQYAYNGLEGIVIHGHNIVGPFPKIWTPYSKDGFEVTKPSERIAFSTLLETGVKAISIDTGAHKGWNLTALIIEESEIYFEQIEIDKCYAD
jgi:hypothetical protein